MKTFKTNLLNWLMSFVVVVSVGGSMMAVVTPQVSSAAGPADNCNQGFLGFPSWYRGLTDSNCDIKSPTNTGGLSGFILRIGLNVLEMAVVAASYMSGFYFLFGGWMFIISQGKPEGAAKARSIMTMALMGLVLTITAVTLMNFVIDKVIYLK
jgi:hypothetical protein